MHLGAIVKLRVHNGVVKCNGSVHAQSHTSDVVDGRHKFMLHLLPSEDVAIDAKEDAQKKRISGELGICKEGAQ